MAGGSIQAKPAVSSQQQRAELGWAATGAGQRSMAARQVQVRHARTRPCLRTLCSFSNTTLVSSSVSGLTAEAKESAAVGGRQRAGAGGEQAAAAAGRRCMCSGRSGSPTGGLAACPALSHSRAPASVICTLTGACRPASRGACPPGTLGASIIYVGPRLEAARPLPGRAGPCAERKKAAGRRALGWMLAAFQRSLQCVCEPAGRLEEPGGRLASLRCHFGVRWRQNATMRLPRPVQRAPCFSPRPLQPIQRLQPTPPRGC